MSKFKMEIVYDSESNNIGINGPLDNTSICDIMIEGARRVVDKMWLERQKSMKSGIAIARPAITPAPNKRRM